MHHTVYDKQHSGELWSFYIHKTDPHGGIIFIHLFLKKPYQDQFQGPRDTRRLRQNKNLLSKSKITLSSVKFNALYLFVYKLINHKHY